MLINVSFVVLYVEIDTDGGVDIPRCRLLFADGESTFAFISPLGIAFV